VASIRMQPLARKQHLYTLLPVGLPLVHARCESRVLLKRTVSRCGKPAAGPRAQSFTHERDVVQK
jgi:hypothetical protein